jgi:hypothetical protein
MGTMNFSLEGFIYLLTGFILIFLYIIKKKGISRMNPDMISELDEEAFFNLKSLLEASYNRTLYLGIAFLFLAYTTLTNSGLDIKALCIFAIIGLFVYNIPPRNKAMKILISSGISLKTLKSKGVRL